MRCGKAFPEHRIGIFALDDETSMFPLPDRTVGEIRLQGPSLMRGYFDDREITTQAFAGGWLRTGDLGYLADGEVVPCGRAKEIVIVNGRNFYPQDIEWEAAKVDGVRKGAIVAFGIWDRASDRERVVVLFETTVVTLDEQTHLIASIRRTIQEGLGVTVDDVVPVAEGVLPKTSSGKLQRLRARLLHESGQLHARLRSREVDRLDEAKELLRSQLSFVVSRLFLRRIITVRRLRREWLDTTKSNDSVMM
ncbi:MAG: AMP-binding protein [Polyangiaceae bacterium]